MSSVTCPRVPTGIPGLDFVLRGGFLQQRIVLVHGGPGTGKTTLALQFLLEGVRRGERVLYITLLQTAAELTEVVRAHGWAVDGLAVLDMPEAVQDASMAEQTLFDTADVELNAATDAIMHAIEQSQPQRVVLDSISELALLVERSYHLHRQLLKLKRHLNRAGCTALFTVGGGLQESLEPAQTIAHGVIALTQETPAYGEPRRQLAVTKMRGMDYAGGTHDFRIRTGGLVVYPRLEVPRKGAHTAWHMIASGNERLDVLLGGGLEEGTACLLLGSSGVGKSTLASLYVQAAAARGLRSVLFCFDEREELFLRRTESLGLGLARHVDRGVVALQRINVGELSPGEFVQTVREKVARQQVRLVVIDSLSGYLSAIIEDPVQQMRQLHELLSYLAGAGALTLLPMSTHGLFGEVTSGVDASYLVDTVILLRHFEAGGAVRRCISVVKKRHGRHETTIREFRVGRGGIQLGEPLEQFSGVLTGLPRFEGGGADLFRKDPRSQGPKGGDEPRASTYGE